MSHFSCFVFGQDVDGQLQKYDENARYFVDNTENWREKYETDTMEVALDDKGNLHRLMDDKFWPPLTKEEEKAEKLDRGFIPSYGWSNKLKTNIMSNANENFCRKLVIPEGYSRVTVPVKQVLSFKEFMTSYHEYESVKEGETGDDDHVVLDSNGDIISVIDYINPDAKWDWYQIGGRWSGSLKTKNTETITFTIEASPKEKFLNKDSIKLTKSHVLPVVRDGNRNLIRAEEILPGDILVHPQDRDKKVINIANGDFVDQAYLKDVDFEGMIRDNVMELEARWEKVRPIIEPFKGQPFQTWEEICEQCKEENSEDNNGGLFDKARRKYNNQPIIMAMHDAKIYGDPTPYFLPKEEFVEKYKYDSITPYAFVEDGEWHSHGDMGWWGVSSNEMPIEEWQRKVWERILKMDGNTLVTMVDCHI